MVKKVNYKCKQNDAIIKFICEKGKIDRLWVKIDGEKSWTIVGFDDLQKGITKALKKCKLKDSHDFGGGYVGEALQRLS